MLCWTYIILHLQEIFNSKNWLPQPTKINGCIHSLDWTTGLDYWAGLLDWTTGLDYWAGLLGWTTGLDYWAGLLGWTTGLDYWAGLLDWTTGLDYWAGLLDSSFLFVCLFSCLLSPDFTKISVLETVVTMRHTLITKLHKTLVQFFIVICLLLAMFQALCTVNTAVLSNLAFFCEIATIYVLHIMI